MAKNQKPSFPNDLKFEPMSQADKENARKQFIRMFGDDKFPAVVSFGTTIPAHPFGMNPFSSGRAAKHNALAGLIK